MSDTSSFAGFGFTGFRSFGSDELQWLGPMDKVHLLAGSNNAGKSNVLSVAYGALPALRKGQAFALDALDRPQRAGSSQEFRLAILLNINLDDLSSLLAEKQQRSNPVLVNALKTYFDLPTFRPNLDDGIAFEFVPQDREGQRVWPSSPRQIAALKEASEGPEFQRTARNLSQHLTGNTGGELGTDAIRVLGAILRALDIRNQIPSLARVDAFRQIGPTDNDEVIEDEYNGPGLIHRLARLQNPGSSQRSDRERFTRIQEFVRTLLDDPNAQIEVPYDRDTIEILHNGQWLPLKNYGTGTHEVVILAVAATVLNDHLVCIEEPEVHLHPSLQRKLLRYLKQETGNKYLIATHSAHLLDSAAASISSVRLDEGRSKVGAVVEPQEVFEIAAELGARASDLVQANAVIWVEGPSDRTYIKAWIHALEPDLDEGIHYSIMFYGGSLLRHLTAEDPSVEEFIRLPRINRNFCLVMDSDRGTAGSQLNQTKLRVRREIEAVAGSKSVWVTQGYTIENYVTPQLLSEAVGAVHPGARCTWRGDRYQDPLMTSRVRGRKSPVEKAVIAREVVERWQGSPSWPLDLKARARQVADFICTANES